MSATSPRKISCSGGSRRVKIGNLPKIGRDSAHSPPRTGKNMCASRPACPQGRFGERCRVEARFSKIIDERCKLRVVFHKAHMFCRYERRELGCSVHRG